MSKAPTSYLRPNRRLQQYYLLYHSIEFMCLFHSIYLPFVVSTRSLAAGTASYCKFPDISKMLRVVRNRVRFCILISLHTAIMRGTFYSPMITEAKPFAQNSSSSWQWRKALKTNLVLLNREARLLSGHESVPHSLNKMTLY